VVRRSLFPVLAVAPTMSELPRRAIAAIDFSGSSLHAARAALSVLQPGGTLLLVHVQPDFSSAASPSADIEFSYTRGIAGAFERLARELAPPPCMRVEPVVLDGTPIDELSAFAERVGAEMIAVGTGRRDLTASHGVARLATALLRQRRHTVLTAPAAARTIQRFLDEA
jgi:nucleotide-binding universal stress UspA family protein